jgi:hypothetical protein
LAIGERNEPNVVQKSYRVDLPDNRADPMIPPSADSITTATSWPSGNRSLIQQGRQTIRRPDELTGQRWILRASGLHFGISSRRFRNAHHYRF